MVRRQTVACLSWKSTVLTSTYYRRNGAARTFCLLSLASNNSESQAAAQLKPGARLLHDHKQAFYALSRFLPAVLHLIMEVYCYIMHDAAAVCATGILLLVEATIRYISGTPAHASIYAH